MIQELEIATIYADDRFNCRTKAVSAIDVVDLCKSIESHGLMAPIEVRPCGELEGDPEGFKYIVTMGHRRLAAMKVLGRTHIPAQVVGGLTEFQYRTRNLIENLKRQDLNILEEAKAIEPYYLKGWSRLEIAKETGTTQGWVQMRCMLLELEPEVQEEFAAGTLKSVDIRDLYAVKDRSKQLHLALRMKKQREQPDKAIVDVISKPTNKATTKKRRNKQEIQWMIDHLMETFGSASLATRVLAWANGEVANYEIFDEIQSECKIHGITYYPPALGDST